MIISCSDEERSGIDVAFEPLQGTEVVVVDIGFSTLDIAITHGQVLHAWKAFPFDGELRPDRGRIFPYNTVLGRGVRVDPVDPSPFVCGGIPEDRTVLKRRVGPIAVDPSPFGRAVSGDHAVRDCRSEPLLPSTANATPLRCAVLRDHAICDGG